MLVLVWLVSLAFAVTLPYWRSSVDVMGLSEISMDPIYRGNADRPLMSLTVNVDWGQEVLPDMLATLKEHDVKVTFFVTGRWAKQFPDLLKQMAEAGHEIANHGMKHAHPKQLSDWDLAMLILENDKLLKGIVGEPSPLFALPMVRWIAELQQLHEPGLSHTSCGPSIPSIGRSLVSRPPLNE